ncbi:MAG: hypothetical protein M1817_001603 [Caeruleum heppii]|nr:MAG: hypothetical protein M1817_001603 [Caeruleum heppii]
MWSSMWSSTHLFLVSSLFCLGHLVRGQDQAASVEAGPSGLTTVPSVSIVVFTGTSTLDLSTVTPSPPVYSSGSSVTLPTSPAASADASGRSESIASAASSSSAASTGQGGSSIPSVPSKSFQGLEPTTVGGSPVASTSPSADESDGPTASRRRMTLIITLSAILGTVALAIFLGLLICARGYFRSAGRVTPVDDEEIETWRVNSTGSRVRVPSPVYETQATSTPSEWVSEKYSERPFSIHSINTAPTIARAPSSPPILVNIARAPNSRAGLTDSTVPGADPFVIIPRRPSSKLQKPAPARTKSARSSQMSRPTTPFSPTRSEHSDAESLHGPQAAHISPRTGTVHYDFAGPVSPTRAPKTP